MLTMGDVIGGDQRIDIGKGQQAIADISRGDHVKFIAKPTGASAVVGNGNHRGDLVGVGLEPQEESGHPGPAAKGDDLGGGF